jgi:hypothetical protein
VTRFAATALVGLALMVPAPTMAQTPVTATWCVTAETDEYDYTSDPAALVEALLAGDVTIVAVDGPEACAVTAVATGMPWLDFLTHAADTMVTYGERMGTYPSDGATLARYRRWAQGTRDLAHREVEWAAQVTPQACYADYHADYLALWQNEERAMGLVVQGIGQTDLAKVRRGTALVVKGNVMIDDLTDRIGSISCDTTGTLS